MFEKPLISIITVNLNNLDGLKRTMQSVVAQTFAEYEYIIIDGGSKDGSKEYIEKHTEQVTHWLSEPDGGIYNAMNKGIELAVGEYLLFLNSGDHLLQKEDLERISHVLNQGEEIIYFDVEISAGDKLYVKKFPSELLFSYFINDSLSHQATFIKASLFDLVGRYDESLKIVSDWKFFVEAICKHNVTYRKIHQTIARHYLDGISAEPENWSLILKERKEYLDQEFGTFMKDSRRLSELQKLVWTLRNSKKIKLMVRLGLLRRF